MGQPKEVVIYAFPYLKWVGISLILLFSSKVSNNLQKDCLLQDLQCILNWKCYKCISKLFLIFGLWIFPKMGVELQLEL